MTNQGRVLLGSNALFYDTSCLLSYDNLDTMCHKRGHLTPKENVPAKLLQNCYKNITKMLQNLLTFYKKYNILILVEIHTKWRRKIWQSEISLWALI